MAGVQRAHGRHQRDAITAPAQPGDDGAQRRNASGHGRVPAVEVMVVTPIVRKYILENTLGEITTVMKQGAYYGMQTFHQALVNLIGSGEISLETALAASSNPEEIMMAVRGVQTGVESSSTFYPQT